MTDIYDRLNTNQKQYSQVVASQKVGNEKLTEGLEDVHACSRCTPKDTMAQLYKDYQNGLYNLITPMFCSICKDEYFKSLDQYLSDNA